jgi:hypothetical protein
MICLTCLRWFDVYVVWSYSYTTAGASDVRLGKAARSDAVAILAASEEGGPRRHNNHKL